MVDSEKEKGKNAVNGKPVENICKSDVGTAFSALPTKSTLDAVEHAQDLMNQRQKRADSSIIIDNPSTEKRKSCSDTGFKQAQSVESEYAIAEPRKWVEKKAGTDNSGTEKSPLQ